MEHLKVRSSNALNQWYIEHTLLLSKYHFVRVIVCQILNISLMGTNKEKTKPFGIVDKQEEIIQIARKR